MNRREILFATVALLSAPLVRAQGARPKHLIGWLSPIAIESNKPILDAFKGKLAELGYVEGRDFGIDARFTDGRPERLPALAREIIALKPAVIVTASSSAIATLQKATSTIPVVFGTAADPVEQGFAKSLGKPGGNITGVTLRGDVVVKVQELVRDCLPAARRVVLLAHDIDALATRLRQDFLENAARLGHDARIVSVKNAGEFGRAFAEISEWRTEAVVLPQLSPLTVHSNLIAGLALKARVPLFAQFHSATASGGLLSYYSDLQENYRRAAVLVDKILKGAKPGDLPIEQPDRYLLAVNLRTARTLGITIPPSLLLRADEVIE